MYMFCNYRRGHLHAIAVGQRSPRLLGQLPLVDLHQGRVLGGGLGELAQQFGGMMAAQGEVLPRAIDLEAQAGDGVCWMAVAAGIALGTGGPSQVVAGIRRRLINCYLDKRLTLGHSKLNDNNPVVSRRDARPLFTAAAPFVNGPATGLLRITSCCAAVTEWSVGNNCQVRLYVLKQGGRES